MLDINNWRDNVLPVVTKWFDDHLEKRVGLIAQVIGVEHTSNYQNQESSIGGFGEMQKYDGNEIKEMRQYKGFKTTYITEEYAGKRSITFKMAKVDLSGEAKKIGRRMAETAHMTMLMTFYRLFANGFNNSYTGADGKALFASDHPIHGESASGDTYSNLGTTVFGIAGITATQTLMRRFVTYDGFPMAAKIDLCLIAPELETLAKQIFGGAAKMLPQTNYNDNNPVYDMKYIVIDGFTAKQWACGDAFLIKEYIKMFVTTDPMVVEQKSSNPFIAEYIGYMDFVMGWSETKMIYGHNPA